MMAEKYKTFTFVDIDVDEQFAEELGEKFGISSIPDVLLFDNGKQVDRFVGFKNESDLEILFKAKNFI